MMMDGSPYSSVYKKSFRSPYSSDDGVQACLHVGNDVPRPLDPSASFFACVEEKMMKFSESFHHCIRFIRSVVNEQHKRKEGTEQ